MIKYTRWRPDTCGCELEYSYDDTTALEVRKHSASGVLKQCAVHAGDKTKESLYGLVLEENQRKNKVHAKLMEVPSLAVEKTRDGKTYKELKEGIEYVWSFDVNRNLIVDIVGATAKEKNDAELLMTEFGDKVIIQK